MSNLKATFEKAVQLASDPEIGGKWSLSTAQKTTMYGCYKKVNAGNVKGDRPSMFNPVARQKYDGWKEASQLSEEDAMKKYIQVVETFAPDLTSQS
jgi:acyl-CoA-binding protein